MVLAAEYGKFDTVKLLVCHESFESMQGMLTVMNYVLHKAWANNGAISAEFTATANRLLDWGATPPPGGTRAVFRERYARRLLGYHMMRMTRHVLNQGTPSFAAMHIQHVCKRVFAYLV